nr:hypothetical protein [Tanacetum cinerariifolium]
KLEEENRSLTNELKSFNTRVKSLTIKETVVDKKESSKQGRKIADIDADAEVNLENVYNLDMAYEKVFSMQDVDVQSERIEDVVNDVEDLVATAENVEGINAATIPKFSKDDVTLAQTLIKIKAAKPKAKGITMQKPSPEMHAERIKVPRKRTRKEKVEKDQPTKKQKGDELEQDIAKKHKQEEQEEAKELKKNLEIVPNDEDDVFVNVTPLSSKPPKFVDYKIYKEGKKEHF